MRIIEEFNGLKGKEQTREDLIDLKNRAIKEGVLTISTRITKLLSSDTKTPVFLIKKLKPISESQGMNAARHSGLAKEGLTECGRAKKGYYFAKGGILKKSPRNKKGEYVVVNNGNKRGQIQSYTSKDNVYTYKVKLQDRSIIEVKENEFYGLKRKPKNFKFKTLSTSKKLSKAQTDLKKRLEEMSNNLGMNMPVITQGMNGVFLADGHEIANDEMLHEEDFSYGMNASAKEVESIVNEMVLDLINSGEDLPPWRQTWASRSPMPAQNFKTKKPYSGSNSMLLNLIYGDLAKTPFYLTPAQVKEMGGSINKGAKTFPIVYYNFSYWIKDFSSSPTKENSILAKVNGYKKRKGKGSYITLDKNNYSTVILTDYDLKKLDLDREDYISKGFLRYYRVVNLGDTTGIEYELPEPKKYPENERINIAEAIIASMVDKPKITYDPKEAFFKPATDTIGIPNLEDFENSQEYYATLFHELIHSTKVESRTNRDRYYEGKKKEQSYAFEELIAELGASYLCGICGFLEYTHKNSASYLKGWHKTLKELTDQHSDFFVFATKEAQKAVDHIIKNFDDTKDYGSKDNGQNDKDKIKAKAKARALMLKLKLKSKS